MNEKAQEKKAIQGLILSLKTQINAAEKQTRQLKNTNKLGLDEIVQIDNSRQNKESKRKEIYKQTKIEMKEVNEIT